MTDFLGNISSDGVSAVDQAKLDNLTSSGPNLTAIADFDVVGSISAGSGLGGGGGITAGEQAILDNFVAVGSDNYANASFFVTTDLNCDTINSKTATDFTIDASSNKLELVSSTQIDLITPLVTVSTDLKALEITGETITADVDGLRLNSAMSSTYIDISDSSILMSGPVDTKHIRAVDNIVGLKLSSSNGTVTLNVSDTNIELKGSLVAVPGTNIDLSSTVKCQLTAPLTEVSADLTVQGNMIVNGTTVTVNADNITVDDPLIKIADNNTASNITNMGMYGQFFVGATKYWALIKNSTDGITYLVNDSSTEPLITTDINTLPKGELCVSRIISTSTTKGNVLPLLSNFSRNNMISPIAGMIIYNTDSNEINSYDGIDWSNHTSIPVYQLFSTPCVTRADLQTSDIIVSDISSNFTQDITYSGSPNFYFGTGSWSHLFNNSILHSFAGDNPGFIYNKYTITSGIYSGGESAVGYGFFETITGEWAQLAFREIPRSMDHYRLYIGDNLPQYPVEFILLGSNDGGTTWNKCHDLVTGWTPDFPYPPGVNDSPLGYGVIKCTGIPYQTYRFVVSKTAGSTFCVIRAVVPYYTASSHVFL